MKTIDERTDEYARKHMYQGGYDIEDVRSAYMDGILAEHEVLTRWNDPKEPPQDQKHKLIKLDDCGYTLFTTGQWCLDSKRWWGAEIDENSKVIGWREIHENE